MWNYIARTRGPVYIVILGALLFSLVFGFVQPSTPNFLVTGCLTLAMPFLFDRFLLRMLDGSSSVQPHQFLIRVLIVTLGVQAIFAGIYRWASTPTDHLVLNGKAVGSFVDTFYFSVITFFTVGYGDITPIGDFRFTVIVEIFIAVVLLSAFLTWGLV
jgi:hypothetical protein